MSIKHINLIKNYSSASVDNLVDCINNNNNNNNNDDYVVLQDVRVQLININNLSLNIHRSVIIHDIYHEYHMMTSKYSLIINLHEIFQSSYLSYLSYPTVYLSYLLLSFNLSYLLFIIYPLICLFL
jgi:hypothetical protein